MTMLLHNTRLLWWNRKRRNASIFFCCVIFLFLSRISYKRCNIFLRANLELIKLQLIEKRIGGIFRILSNIWYGASMENCSCLSAVNCFCKKHHLRCSGGGWICFRWWIQITILLPLTKHTCNISDKFTLCTATVISGVVPDVAFLGKIH